MATVLGGLRDHLVVAGIVRRPTVSGSVPPLWLAPQLGVNAPGEGKTPVETSDTVLAAYLTGGIPAGPYESEWRRATVDIKYRAKSSIPIEEAYLAITREVLDRRDWMMGQQYVIECLEFRPLQLLGSDEQGYESVSSLLFELMR